MVILLVKNKKIKKIQIQIQLYLITESPLQLNVVLPWGGGYNVQIYKTLQYLLTYVQKDTYK